MLGIDLEGNPYGPENAEINWEHPLADRLGFAWAGARGEEIRDLVDGLLLRQGSTSSVFADSEGDGFGIDCTAADLRYSGALVDPWRFQRGLTWLWRGVIRGAQGATNYGSLWEVGNSSQSFVSINRDPSNADVLAQISQSGGSYIIGQADLGLSACYNVPVILAGSLVAGENGAVLGIRAANGYHRVEDHGYAAATNGPFSTNGSEYVMIGVNAGAGRYSNTICTGLVLYQGGMLKGDVAELMRTADDIFTSMEDDAYMLGAPGAPAFSDVNLQSIRRGIAVGLSRGV